MYSFNDPTIDTLLKDTYAHPEHWTGVSIFFYTCVLSLFVFVGWKVLPTMLKRRNPS